MSDTHIVCPSCGGINRIPDGRNPSDANCGSCHKALFTGKPVNLTDANFHRFVEKTDLPVVVDFWAAWCGPCQAMAPAFESVTAEMEPKLRFAKVDTDAAQGLAARFGIRSIPTVILFDKSREVTRQAGAMSAAQLKQWITQST